MFLHRKHTGRRRWKFLLSTEISVWIMVERLEDSLQLRTNSKIKVKCFEMFCDVGNEHLLCNQWTAEDTCSHRYIASCCSVSELENSLKRTFEAFKLELHPPPWLHPPPSSPVMHICGGLVFFLDGFPSRLLWQKLNTYQWNWVFCLILRRSKDGCWLGIKLYVLFFTFSAKKAHALLPLAETCLYSQIVCAEVFHAPVMTSVFLLLNRFPVRLPIELSIFISYLSWFLPIYSRQQFFVLEHIVTLECILTQ